MVVNSSSAGNESLLKKTTSPTKTVNKPRMKSIATMSFLRSKRSVRTPACNVKINHGKRDAKPAAAIKIGERVTADASHG